MPSPLPSPPGTFHTPWPPAPGGRGCLFSTSEAGGAGLLLLVPRDRWGVWLKVMIVADFLVKCGQETAHPSGNSRRLALGVPGCQCSNMARGNEAAFSSRAFTTELCLGRLC